MTGHGVFASYLHKIGKMDSPTCGYCKLEVDTAEHTLMGCEEWSVQRRELVEAIGIREEELSLGMVVKKGVESEEAWKTFQAFANSVMGKKESDERRPAEGDEDSGTPVR